MTAAASWWRPSARRIHDLRHNGQPVADAAMFAVVTNNYRASGGGSFPGLDGSNIILDAPDENREALVQYLQAQAADVDPSADGNWRVLAGAGREAAFHQRCRRRGAPGALPADQAGQGQRRRHGAVRTGALCASRCLRACATPSAA
jgi:hypothetical protein